MKKLLIFLLSLISVYGFPQKPIRLGDPAIRIVINDALTMPIVATGINAYAGTLTSITNVTNQAYDVLFTNGNTTTSTFALNGGAAVPLKKYNSLGSLVDLVSGDIPAGSTHKLRYNGTSLVIQGGVGGGSGITIGTTTITSGTDTRILKNTAGVLGEYSVSGTGNVAMTTSPVFTTPNIGTATGDITGNAATVTTIPSLSGDVTNSANAITVTKINGTALSGLATGILKNTTTTGVPSIAVSGTDIKTVNGSSILGSGDVGTINIAHGGTGLTALGTAFQGLQVNSGATALEYYTRTSNPMTTTGDIVVAVASGVPDKLSIGSTNQVLTVTAGTPAWGPIVTSGTYTPTLTNVANLDASTAYLCTYMRVGSTVTVSGRVDIDPTTTTTSTQLGISLPVASAMATANQTGGTAVATAIAGQAAAIRSDATNDRAELIYIAVDVTNQPMYFTFTYQIL